MDQLTCIQHDFGKVSKIGQKIIFTEFYSNDNFGIDEARTIDNARNKLSGGKKFYSLVSLISVFGHMTKEAQTFLGKESKCSKLILHEVVLVNNLPTRILTKYFIKFINPPYKIEVAKQFENGLKILKQRSMDHDNRTQH
ncbi:MAG: hypothetical protein AB8B74_07190 [Crocinitomicaceae bacterium]